MLLYFLALVFCTYNQIAVEYGRVPITRVSIDGKQIKQSIHNKMAANYSNDKISFSKSNSPSSLHNIHLFLEENFSLENQTFVTKSGRMFKFSTLENEVDRDSLISLYFHTLLSDKYQIKPNSPLNVSSRDYFTLKQSSDMCSIFGSLDYKVKSIPESLAACIQNVEFGINAPVVKNFYLNFKGSKVIGLLYEITQENNTTKITLLESKEFNLKSDYDFENLAATHIMQQLKDNVSYLPYQICDKQCFSDIQDLVLDYLRDLKGELSEFPILEVNYFDKSTNQKSGSITDKSISFDLLRNEISNDMALNLNEILQSIPEDANKFIITDIPYREKSANGFSLVYWDNIVKGLLLAHDSKYILNDSRITNSNFFGYSTVFRSLKNEINLRYDVKNSIIPTIQKTISEFKFLNESEKNKILDMIEENDFSIKSLSSIRDTWESIQKLNTRREADSICRNENIKNLELAITNAKNLIEKIDINSEKDFINNLEESVEWLKNARDDPNANEFLIKATKLNAYVNYINKKIKQAEEQKIQEEIKAQEEFKKAIEAQAKENTIDSPENTEPDKFIDSHPYSVEEKEVMPEDSAVIKQENSETETALSEKTTLNDEQENNEDEGSVQEDKNLPIDVERDDDSFKNRIL